MQPSPETYPLPENFTPQKQQKLFEEIVEFYDLADGIMASITPHDPAARELQFELAKPFVTQIVNSANILSAFYTDIVRNGRPVTAELRDTYESAFRNVIVAFKEFLDSAEEKLLPKEGI